MEQNSAPSLEFSTQYIKDVSFENPNAPRSLIAAAAPQVQVDIQVQVQPLDQLSSQNPDVQAKPYEVTLLLRANAARGDESVFVVELSYAGIFTPVNVPEQDLQPLLMIEAPRLLFPFARAQVATLTRDGGFPPLLINPIDFAVLYQQQVTNGQNNTKTA